MRTTPCCVRSCRCWTTKTASRPASRSTRSATWPRASARGVLHKYAGRALLIATGSCAVHCRYCFRRHFPYAEEVAARGGWRDAVAAIPPPTPHPRGHPQRRRSVVAGHRQAGGTDRPAARRSRTLNAAPAHPPADRAAGAGRPRLLDWLLGLPWPVAVVVHANHAGEIDGDVAGALVGCAAAAPACSTRPCCCVASTTALRPQAALSEALFASGVLPYYLHQLDRVRARPISRSKRSPPRPSWPRCEPGSPVTWYPGWRARRPANRQKPWSCEPRQARPSAKCWPRAA
jgi:hypothetical protein